MENRKKEICILSTTGSLGCGFKKASFEKALLSHPSVIGADSGSSDDGPYYLGEGVPRMNRAEVKSDMRTMLFGGVKNGIPVLVGSAGTSGADPNVDWLIDIVKEIALEEGLHFKLAEIKTELDRETLRKYMRAGKMTPLEGAPKFEEKDLDTLHRCVGVMGAEPFIEALKNGAQVVIAGRSTDTAIFSSVPIMNGLANGFAWHAGKILECDSSSAAYHPYSDCMLAWVREDSLSAEPVNEIMWSTPLSTVAHTLYENANPFVLTEPGGSLITKDSRYEAETDRRVRITGSKWIPAEKYTVKLEGVRFDGYRCVAIGGIKDPLVLRQLYPFLDKCVSMCKPRLRKIWHPERRL